MLSREEHIEQVYFYRTLRERLATNLAGQEKIGRASCRERV